MPSIGRIVHVIVDPAENNGFDVAPAVITRVWDEDAMSRRWLVNYRVLLDEQATPWKTSAYLYPDEEAARASETGREGQGFAAFWPPRTGGPIVAPPSVPPVAEPVPEPTPPAVDPRARLVELAAAIEDRAKVVLDPAALYGVAASIWEFLDANPAPAETVVVHQHQCAPLDDDRLRAFLARERARFGSRLR